MDKGPFHKNENDKNFDNKEDEDDRDFSPLSAPTDLTNEGQLITNFKRSGDNSEASKDEAFSYLQEIAKTPLLTPTIEKELFAEFGNQRKDVTRLLECFPDSILENSKPKVNRRRCNKDGLTGVEAWWTPMNISVVIENMEKEIRSYKLRMYGDFVPSLEEIEVNDEIEKMGAKVIEKHVTISKKKRGPDHSSSSSIKDFFSLVKQIRELEIMLGGPKKKLLQSEKNTKDVSRKSLITNKDLIRGKR